MSLAPLYLVCFLSGAAGLGYQLVWAKLIAAGLGHEFTASSAVLSALMLGMAIGNWLAESNAFLRLTPPKRYAIAESIIGVWGAASPWLITSTSPALAYLVGLDGSPGRQAVLSFLYPMVLLLPATIALGLTFPALTAWTQSHARESVGKVYALNTAGGVAGLFVGMFALLPHTGLRNGAFCFASVNLLCGLVAFLQVTNSTRSKPAPAPPLATTNYRHLFISGFLALIFEVIGLRLLSQVLENTAYSYAAMLSAYLAATAVGAWVARKVGLPSAVLGVMAGIAFTTASVSLLSPAYHSLRTSFGDSTLSVALAEFLIALFALGLPCFFMGVIFTRLVTCSPSVGTAVAINTAGAGFAPLITSFLLLPSLHTRWTLFLLTGSYLLIGRPRRMFAWIAPALALTAVAMLPLQIVDAPPGHKVIVTKEGPMAVVTTIEDGRGERVLRVNNRLQMGGTAAAAVEYRQAVLPLLTHPAPHEALFLGVGTGITLGGASQFNDVSLHAVELVPEIVQTMAGFSNANYAIHQNARAKILVADARRFIRETPQKFDLIVADVFHPWQDGASALYTTEHFTAVRARLSTNGLFWQWIPLHQVSEDVLQVMIHTFQNVFPNAEAWLLHLNIEVPVLGLVSSPPPREALSARFKQCLEIPATGRLLRSLSLTDDLRVLGHFLAGSDTLRRWSERARLNTDDSQIITFEAPRFAVRFDQSGGETLMKLIRRVSSDESTGISPPALRDYLRARNSYLEGLQLQSDGNPDAAVQKFIESAALSPSFTPGYAQVITFAAMQAKESPAKAKALLEALVKAQPERPVARQLLEGLKL